MTRTLPWKRSDGASSSRSSPAVRRPASGSSVPRVRKEKPPASSSDLEDTNQNLASSRKATKPRAREPSTSPPPTSSQPGIQEGPEEIFMRDGLDQDDRYRMVEDEFLQVAKKFTRHLHAAEYQRMKREARSQNSATINSISRPVTMKMSDHTRRKTEGAARARKQAKTLRGLLGKRTRNLSSDEDEDDDEGAWTGTALHGLMGSPQKSAASLVKAGGSINPTTRAAAGFKKYHAPRRHKHVPSSPPELDESDTLRVKSTTHEIGGEISEDDDLDAPPVSSSAIPLNHQGHHRRLDRATLIPEKSISNAKTSVSESQLPHIARRKDPQAEISDPSSEGMARIARRREQARLQQERSTKERPKKETDLDVIPTFL